VARGALITAPALEKTKPHRDLNGLAWPGSRGGPALSDAPADLVRERKRRHAALRDGLNASRLRGGNTTAAREAPVSKPMAALLAPGPGSGKALPSASVR
jgi:hypothetical protein